MISKLTFSIEIETDKQRIWEALWQDESYREWASIFFEGSYAVADSWDVGSRILFLAPDQSGIYSVIQAHLPQRMITFKHIGMVLNGEEQEVDEETKKWSGTIETYTLTSGAQDSFILTIDIDVLEKHLNFMKEKLPEALKKIKEIAMRK